MATEATATNVATTKMSSKGQVVIPEAVRNQLGLKSGVQFAVIGLGDTVVLKVITPPSLEEFESALKALRREAKAAGLTRRDVKKTIVEVRNRK